MILQNLPNGAHALLIALQTPAARGNMGIPTLIWGKPGEGKSSFLENLEKADFPVLTLIASIHDPTDFSGLPVFQQGKVHYAEPEWLTTFENTKSGILFLDELTTAPPAVQAALLRVVLERRVGFHELPSDVRIVAAANPTNLVSGGWELSPPLRNRFLHLEWSLGTSTYIHAMENGFETADLPKIDRKEHAQLLQAWKLKVAAFLKRNPALLSQMPKGEESAFPTPRSWEYVAALSASCQLLGYEPNSRQTGNGVYFELIGGCLGDGAAVAFAEFLSNMRIPSPEEVLDGKTTVQVSGFNDSELYVLFIGLSHAVMQSKNQPQFLKWFRKYLEITDAVAKNSRLDIVYPSLQKAARSNLLFDAVAAGNAISASVGEEVRERILSLFRNEGLKDFIKVLEGR